MPTHTLTEMTNLIADARQLPRNEWPQAHRAVRNWHAKSLLVPADLDGSDSEPARFDDAAVCKACLFATLADMGFDVSTLRKADAAMNQPVPVRETEHAIYSERGIEAAVAGIRRGEEWYFHLELKGSSSGVRYVIGRFSRDDSDDVSPLAAEIIADADVVPGERSLGRIVIPAHDVLRPLIGALDRLASEPLDMPPPPSTKGR